MPTMTPYSNDAASIQIDELTVENNPDRVAVYGSVQLTKDKIGLKHARELKAIIDAVVTSLEADNHLPDKITIKPGDQVDNPFK